MRVAIVGTGYVGLVTGAALASLGHRVVCVDTDRERVGAVRRGETPIHEEGLPELVKSTVASGRLDATADLADAARWAEISMICVGTPTRDAAIDLSLVEAAAGEIGAALKGRSDFPVVAVKSTVTPGTTDTLVRRAVESAGGGRAGEDFGLAMNPEFLSQGQALRDFLDADRIVVGAWDERSARIMAELYRPLPAPLLAMTLREAEAAKYAHNALQATLISFANQIASLCECTPGTDVARVMEAVHLDRMLDGPDGKRCGAIRFLVPGIGFGGSCFPKDLAALSDHARRHGAETALLDATLAVNAARPDRVLDLLDVAIGGLWEKRVAVLGLAFKPGTDDLRESPGLRLANRLAARGASVSAHDPLEAARRNAASLLDPAVAVAEGIEAALADRDGAVIATAWPEYRACDWEALARRMRKPVVLDGRGILDGLPLPAGMRVVRIGTGYQH